MKPRITIFATASLLAVSGTAAHTAGASIPWSGGSSSAAQQPTRTLAVVREGYDWRDYVNSHIVGADYRFVVAKRLTDAHDRRDGLANKVYLLDSGYNQAAYVHGGAPLKVAKAIAAAGKQGSGTERTVQSGGTKSPPRFSYPR
jgi:hypothetical protein